MAHPTSPSSAAEGLTPAMRQYRQFKQQHPGYVLFFRMGDFYEMFWEDAELCARVLGVALTTRSKGGLGGNDAIPMAGVPYHAVEGYLRKMIAAGYRVALCEQTEDASQAKGLVRREVVRLLTPGTLTDEALLDGRSDNFLAAVAAGVGGDRSGGSGPRGKEYRVGLAWVELSTGAFFAASGPRQSMLDELTRLRPAETLVPELPTGQLHDLAESVPGHRTPRPAWQFAPPHAADMLARHYGTRGASGFGFGPDDPATLAIGAVLSYLEETQKSALSHLRPPKRHELGAFLRIDPASWRSLEVERTVRSGSVEGSLLGAIDRTRTPMGGRLLRQWLRAPLTDVHEIARRQEVVATLLDDPLLLKKVTATLDHVCDIERVMGRLAVNRATPRDVASLGRCLRKLPELLEIFDRPAGPVLGLSATAAGPATAESQGPAGGRADGSQPPGGGLVPELAGLAEFCRTQGAFIASAVREDPALHLREGGVIAPGFDAELDRLHDLQANAATWLQRYQQKLAAETGIPSLRVSYNKVFGYYIEVTDTHRAKVPEGKGWVRKQTVRNAERYITEELKRFEEEALSAAERAVALEQKLFEAVRQRLLPELERFQTLAAGLARLDVLSSFAALAQDRRYCRPVVTTGRELTIVEGRHPVLEQQLGRDFVANDVEFPPGTNLQLITGPNMAGKSTYIRQVALLVLMAQVGSFVPAKSATVGVVDRLFTRIGASDELHAGQSTFMVEMTETANLLNNATERSLVILDEIGRGTSTLDGLALAWAIAEHLASEVRCRALFATHYHELTDLAQRFRSVRNLNVAVREWEDQVVFLHRIVEGGTDRSYGIHVARLAGIPPVVLERARQLMSELSVQHVSKPRLSKSKRPDDLTQLPLFVDPMVEFRRELAELELERLSPAQLYDWLSKWKVKLR
ncbi:MAG: DNA mismatch repair protein MutS [Tepidisphaerales bacterium]